MRNANPAGEMPLAQRFGLDLSNVAPTIWELVPMSWLFDYFANQNDIIDAWSLRFLDFGWLSQTEIQEVETSLVNFRKAPGAEAPGLSYGFHIYRPGKALYRYVTRAPRDNDFITPFQFRLPGYPGQLLNVAALSKMWYNVLHGVTRPVGNLRI
jgi:hypothetical protein